MKGGGAAAGFHYHPRSAAGELFCDQFALARAAARWGTPLYVYSARTLAARWQALDQAFAAAPHRLCYSVKASSNISLLKLLWQQGAGFDVVSGGELERVLRAGGRPAARMTVFSGVGKTAAEIDGALAAGILMFNVESEGELRLLAGRAARARRRARVALRVNPDISAATHPYIATGLRRHKFGIPIPQALALYRQAAREPWLEPCGVSVHIGSQITSMAPFRAAMARVAKLVRELRAAGTPISYLNAGGGLGIRYRRGRPSAPGLSHEDFRAQAAAYAQAILPSLRGLGVHLLLEPGRWLAAPAGVLLTRVLYLKQNRGRSFAVCDAAMNDLLRPALYRAYHEIVPVRLSSRSRARTYDIVGPVCESADFLGLARRLPQLKPGDLLAVLDAGAYGMALASNYNSRPRAAELLVEGASARVIRKRESITGMLALEV